MSESAAKELIFALAGQVYRVSTDYETRAALDFEGRWTSRTLNAESSFQYHTLNDLYLRYRGVGTISVRYTGDGGATWTAQESQEVNDGIIALFRPLITGRDIRFEIILPDSGVTVSAYRARLSTGSVFNA